MANAPARDDKDYRKEMEELIRSEGGKRETSVSREISDQGESATRLRTEVEEKQELRTDETNMLKYLTEEQGLQFVSLEDYPRPSMNILRLIPAQMARDYKVFPIRFESDGSLLIAISDPLNIHIVDDLRLFLDKNITPVVCPEDEIIDYIDLHYGIGDETIEKMVEEMEQEADEEVLQTDSSEVDLSDLEKTASAPPVIKWSTFCYSRRSRTEQVTFMWNHLPMGFASAIVSMAYYGKFPHPRGASSRVSPPASKCSPG